MTRPRFRLATLATAPLGIILTLGACTTIDETFRTYPPTTTAPLASTPAAEAAETEPSLPGEYRPSPGENLIPYTVRPGDTIWRIARDQESSITKIKAANQLTSDLIRPGEVLQVPTRRTQAAVSTRPAEPTAAPAPAYRPRPSPSIEPAEIPAPAPSATNPVIQGDQVPPSSLGREAPARTEPSFDIPLLPPPPPSDG